MPRRLFFFALMTCCGCAQALTIACCRADEAESAERLQALASQLGAKTWAEREQATSELLRAGVPALPALNAALNASDAEVRSRARNIRARIDQDDYQHRLREFAADSAGRQQSNLPGWQQFRKRVGDDEACRKFFVSLAQVARPMLESVEAGPAAVGRQLDEELPVIHEMSFTSSREVANSKSIAKAAAILFAAGDSDVPVNAEVANGVGALSCSGSIDSGLAKAEQAPMLHKILGLWISRKFATEALEAETQRTRLIASLAFAQPEGLPIAQAVLTQATPAKCMIRSLAILTVGKHGNKQHLALLEPILKDSDNWLVDAGTGGNKVKFIGGNTQVGDLALAMSIHLYGRSPREFGFKGTERPDDMFPHARSNYDANRFFDLNSPTRREGAFKKWAATLAMDRAVTNKDQAGIAAAKHELADAENMLLNVQPATTIPAAKKDDGP